MARELPDRMPSAVQIVIDVPAADATRARALLFNLPAVRTSYEQTVPFLSRTENGATEEVACRCRLTIVGDVLDVHRLRVDCVDALAAGIKSWLVG